VTVPDREIEIAAAHAPDDVAAVRDLIEEYQRSLGIDLGFQGFDDELARLAEVYGPPGGALFLARLHGQPVGCVGVRRLDEATCEMKRLYVRPVGRGRGLGRRLAVTAMASGRAAGYAAMRLDTLPAMREAQALYERLGFVEVAPYRANPVPGARFLEARLQAAAISGTTSPPRTSAPDCPERRS
jgi:ribosomal protein S18 acetylase RimI-like enzyme